MFTITPILITSKENARGLSPIKLLVTIGKKQSLHATGIRIKSTDWKDGQVIAKAPNAKLINAHIRQRANELEAQLLEAELKEPLTIKRAAAIAKGKQPSTNMALFIEGFMKSLSSKYSEGRMQHYKVERERLILYGGAALSFDDITPSFLRSYEHWLRSEAPHQSNKKTKGLSGNSVHKSWKILKRIFTVARNEGLAKHNPFAGYDNPKYISPDRSYLTGEEQAALEKALQLPITEGMRKTGYYFLLSCNCGLRDSDFRRFSRDWIRNDKLILRAKKNGELVCLPMHSKLKELIDICLEMGSPPTNIKMNEYIKRLCEMAGINKHITIHSGRHSFAVKCAELGISEEATAEFLGISKQTVKVYYRMTGVALTREAEKLK